MPSLNYEKELLIERLTLNSLQHKNLTLIGKINISKTKCTHMPLSTPDKINRQQICKKDFSKKTENDGYVQF